LVFSRGLILADRVNQARRLLMGNLEILANTPTGEHMLRVLTLTLLDEVSSETSL
jgi:hypothetical protein